MGTDVHPGHERMRGFLSIPYLDVKGEALTLRFRCLQDHDHVGHGKYLSLTHDPSRVYNVGAIHTADDVIEVAEGELDAVVLGEIGLHAIAIPGANGWKPHHQRMLAGFSRVRVWADPDEPGALMGSKITSAMRNAKVVRLTQGDVGKTYEIGGAKALLDLLKDKK